MTSTKIESVVCLSRSQSLKWLNLASCDLTDAGTRGLELIPTLEDLNLDSTYIREVAHLARSTSLKRLNLSWCDISPTDDGLQALKLIPTLEELILGQG
jgi:hypothetical protein